MYKSTSQWLVFFCAFLHSLGFLNKISLFYKNISTRYVTEVFQLLYQTLCLLFYRLRSTPKVTNNQKKLISFSLIRCRCCDSGFVYNLITKTSNTKNVRRLLNLYIFMACVHKKINCSRTKKYAICS